MDATQLHKLLCETNYDRQKTSFLVNGFSVGFDIGYRGPTNVRMTAPNLKLTVGSLTELWNKVMGEVKAQRYAGPYDRIPFSTYIQSPIGLVPKDINKTRLIFHLSYPRNSGTSVNANTPEDMCSVEYPDFDQAIQLCLLLEENGLVFVGKSEMSSAFRHLCICISHWRYLVMKAMNPVTKKYYFFVDKCLPFGSSISCSHFQKFSDAIAHIVYVKTGFLNINYLDDYLFIAYLEVLCNQQIRIFIQVCEQIRFPVSKEKTCWACNQLKFLGLLIDTKNRVVSIPLDKVCRALEMIDFVLNKRNRKITLKQLQRLCGFLNFLCKAVVPGRAFTRRLYSFGSHLVNDNHHLSVTAEMRMDLEAWRVFVGNPAVFSRPFFNFLAHHFSVELDWFTDASKRFGLGGIFGNSWFIGEWDPDFIRIYDPSINYLELFALTAGVLLWLPRVRNQSITLFCDNMSVVYMVNNTTSKCKNCMVLIRILVLQSMIQNVRVTVKHVAGDRNNFFGPSVSFETQRILETG